jgi:hypothetical protein
MLEKGAAGVEQIFESHGVWIVRVTTTLGLVSRRGGATMNRFLDIKHLYIETLWQEAMRTPMRQI